MMKKVRQRCLLIRNGIQLFDAKSLYLNPAKNTVNAFIHQQDINVLAQDDYQSLSIQGNGALGITENSYIGVHWNFNGYDADDVSDSNADVSDLYYRYDFYVVISAGGSHGQPHTI